MMLAITIVLILSIFYCGTETIIQPSPNSRDAYANSLLLSLIMPLAPELPPQPVVLFSPASMQKLLVAFYNFTYQDDMRLLAQDLCLVDGDTFVPTKVAEILTGPLPVRLRQGTVDLITGYIAPHNVKKFFAKDFAELGADILVRNFFIHDGDHELASSFHRSVWEYFNIEVLSKRQLGVASLLAELGIASPDVKLYSGIKFHAYLDQQFRSVGKFSYARGRFRFAERLLVGQKRIPCVGLELPLQTESGHGLLTLLLLMPGPKISLEQLEAQLLGPDQRSYQNLSRQLLPTSVSVRLPNLQFFGKVTMERSKKEMSWLFDAELPYQGMFNNPRRTRIKRFVQTISMRIHTHGGSSRSSPVQEPVNPLRFFYTNHTFDCATRPFLFLVRSKDVIYFMGRHCRISAWAGAHFGRI
ncbi:uncharacterized protein LOC111076229 [Drosophila obscura]|uniref:uncharacterized protein LOC111076229 n=1 Tax=Drosophila obscura TaxID=7282 RepID=UPI001BB181E7|nr:uncharacterized protein LOC111076229 [Drosophila obscura]